MAERGGRIIAQLAPTNERMMISAREKRRIRRGTGGLSSLRIPAPFFLYPLYTLYVPLNATYGSPFRKVASRIFVGRAGREPPRRRQWPSIPPPHITDRSSFSFPPPRRFSGLRERKDRERRRRWAELAGTRKGAPGCAALIPAARFRSQFSRALTRLLSPLAEQPPYPFSLLFAFFRRGSERKPESTAVRPLTDRRIVSGGMQGAGGERGEKDL